MINLFNFNTLGIISQFKLYSILCMVLIFFFLLLMEIIHKYLPNNNNQISGFAINKNITRFMGIVGGSSAFGSFLINRNKKDITDLCNNLNKQSEDLKKEIVNLENSQSDIIVSVLAKLNSINDSTIEMKKHLDKAKELLNKKNDIESITTNDINSNSDLQYQLSQIEVNWNKVVNFAEEFKKDIDKNHFLPNNYTFDVSNLYKNISNDQLGGIGLIFFSQVILASAISIVFVFFGEYLIQRYNLEVKYPKLAKFIQLRRKFQKYYLILNILYIGTIGIILGIFGLWLYFS